MKRTGVNRFFRLALWLLAGLACGTPIVLFAITPEQRREAAALSQQIKEAGTLFTQGKFQESADVVKQVQTKLEELAKGADPEMLRGLQQIQSRVVRAHALLELEGIELPPIVELKAGGDSAPGMPGGGVSFTKQVAPMLVARCGNCHVNNSRGQFNMATYAQLMRGSNAGRVVFAGDAVGSRLVEVIETGDMPRGGGTLTAEELKALKDWITQGAKFDGADPMVNLTTFAPNAAAANQPTTVAAATGKETVSFARDIAPILAANCNSCHVNPQQQARGGLNMSSFEQMLRGGDSGPVIAPRKPADSILLARIKGEGGEARMPQGRPPLSDEVIAKIQTWIAEGATFDGNSPTQNVVRVAALAKAQAATHEELSEDRVGLAGQNWQLGMPGIPSKTVSTTNFLLVGNTTEAALTEYGEIAEAIAPKVANLFGIPADKPLIKGRMTLYFFGQRYDYSEFGQMVEKRELPRDWRGHWRFDVVDAYGAIITPRENEYALDGVIAEQLAATYVASLSDVPHWFADGSGRAAVIRLMPKDPRGTVWKGAVPAAMGSVKSADDFIKGKVAPEVTAMVGFGFVDALMKNSKGYRTLLDNLRSGKKFEEAFAMTYNATPTQAFEVWGRTAARRR